MHMNRRTQRRPVELEIQLPLDDGHAQGVAPLERRDRGIHESRIEALHRDLLEPMDALAGPRRDHLLRIAMRVDRRAVGELARVVQPFRVNPVNPTEIAACIARWGFKLPGRAWQTATSATSPDLSATSSTDCGLTRFALPTSARSGIP